MEVINIYGTKTHLKACGIFMTWGTTCGLKAAGGLWRVGEGFVGDTESTALASSCGQDANYD